MEKIDQSSELSKRFAILDQQLKYDECAELPNLPNLFEDMLFTQMRRQKDPALETTKHRRNNACSILSDVGKDFVFVKPKQSPFFVLVNDAVPDKGYR